jgi:hypothetical protein
LIVCEIITYKNGAPEGEVRKKHMNFLRESGQKGKLLMVGRFADLKGALILWQVASVEEARGIAEKDPYVIEGLVTYDLREWPAIFDYTKTPPLVS